MIANIIFFALFLTVAHAGYAGTYNGNYVGGGGAGGYGYGYGGGFPGYPQQFYAPIPFDFAQLMAGPNAKAYTSISVEPPFKGKISARARITFHGLNQIQARLQQQAAAAQQHSGGGAAGGYAYSGAYPSTYQGNSYPATYAPASIPRTNAHQGGSYNPTYPANTANTGFSGGYGGGYGGSYGGGGGYGSAYGGSYGGSPQTLASYPRYGAGASASIGGGGVKQTAFLNPANPASPNVNVRFAGTPGGNSKSVFVSSSSSSGNVNGTPYHQRQASTTVNDNGKVSTYAVHDKK